MGKVTDFFGKIENLLTSDDPVTPQRRRLLGILFLVLAIICGSLYFVKPYWNPMGQEHIKIVTPNPIHCIVGILLGAPLYFRNFILFEKISIYRMICLALNIYTFSLITVFVLGRTYSWTHNFTTTFLLGAILLSWLGIRSVAGFVWILFFGFGLLNSIKSATELGIFGTLFLIFGIISILFQANATPKGLFSLFKDEFRGADQNYGDEVRKSVNESKDSVKKAASKVI